MSAREAKSIRARGEIEAALRVFTSAQWARLHYVARIHAWRTGWTFDELLQEAILRTLAGDRNCPSDVNIMKRLVDSMSSIADGERKKAPNQSPHVPVVGPGEPVAGAENPAAPEISREEALVGAADQEEIRREVLAIFDDDPVARDIVEGIMANYSADELKELSGLQGKDPQVIVFTQFTDTMDYLRDQVVASGYSVMCYSGRGGEVRNSDGTWTSITRDEVKRRFKEGRSEVLVCTDAAAEGLNFQFCGALVNYDMPWNPMRVEQRIGRIDRLGQRFSDIRIVNFHYEDTVEADVYRALRDRISIFEKVVGGLQPILARWPKLIEETVLSKSTGPDGKRDEAVKALENAISAGEGSALDLDDYADENLELSVRPDPAISLSDLRAILDRPKLLPLGLEAVHLNDKDYRFVDGYLPQAVRITVDREFYEMHADSVEFWTPGSPTFPDLEIYRR